MGSGGARATSGPPPQPGSRTSERKGFVLTALPAEGYSGAVPALGDFLPAATVRHEAVWAQLWATPQACAWSETVSVWAPQVADLVKWVVRSEADDAAASIAGSVRQLREDLGITAAGRARLGWKIAEAPTPASDDEPTEDDASVTDLAEWLAGGA